MILTILAIIFAIFQIMQMIKLFKKKGKTSIKVIGVEDQKDLPLFIGKRYYFPIYKYYIDGKEHTYQSNIKLRLSRKRLQTTLFLNPETGDVVDIRDFAIHIAFIILGFITSGMLNMQIQMLPESFHIL